MTQALAHKAIGAARDPVGAARYLLSRRRMGAYRFERVTHCLCGEEGGVAARSRQELGHSLELVLCERCGLGRLSPRLADADLARYYRDDYSRTTRGTAHIEEEYFERGRRRGRRLTEYLRERGETPPPGSAVLEVGTAAGGILAAFREEGHRVAGSDLDPRCVAFARSQGLDVVQGEGIDAPAIGPAGLIVLSHLVEHLPDPLATLAALEPHVDAGTRLYVEVPGLRAPMGPGEQVPHIPHLYYYDLTSLTWLLGRAGWRRVHGDEQVRALFRRGDPGPTDTSENLGRNLAVLESS